MSFLPVHEARTTQLGHNLINFEPKIDLPGITETDLDGVLLIQLLVQLSSHNTLGTQMIGLKLLPPQLKTLEQAK